MAQPIQPQTLTPVLSLNQNVILLSVHTMTGTNRKSRSSIDGAAALFSIPTPLLKS